jgi:peptidoglycan/LPS O-acetylase OafA/YrhL
MDILENWRPLIYVWPVCRAPEFVAGMVSARICGQMPLWAREWDGWGWVFDGLILANTAAWWMLPKGEDEYIIMLEHLFPFLVSLLNIASFAAPRINGVPTSGLLGRCLSCAPLQKLAAYSYAVYVLQLPTFYTCNCFLPQIAERYGDKFYFWSLFLPIVMCHVTAVAAVRLVQEPAESLSDAFFKKIS